MTDDLATVLRRAAAGDRRAEEELVARTIGDVWAFCAHQLDPLGADDATQLTYMRALRSLSRFRGESTVRTWLIGIARHTCLDELRGRERHRRLIDRLRSRRAEEVVEDAPRPAELEDLVRALPRERREAFVLTQLLGFTYAEAATVLDCPIGTVRSRVARAREQMAAGGTAYLTDDDAAAR